MNRQQFSKYVSGASRPLRRNLYRTSEFFRVTEAQLHLPHKEFVAKHAQHADFFLEKQFENLFPASNNDLQR